MMSLNEKILTIYSELRYIPYNPMNPLYILQDDSDGQGPYIKEWNYLKPKPTQQQLDELE